MEKRKSPRVKKRLEVKFQTKSENTVITNDLSETGLFLRTTKRMNPGYAVDLKLNLPNSKQLLLSGRVIRNIKSHPGAVGTSNSGLGIELINPPSDYINYIQTLRY